MPKFEFLSASHGDTLLELIEIVEANNKILDWILHTLDSENISEVDTTVTNVHGGNLSITGDSFIISDARSGTLVELSPNRNKMDGMVATGVWDFSGATVTGL